MYERNRLIIKYLEFNLKNHSSFYLLSNFEINIYDLVFHKKVFRMTQLLEKAGE